MGTPIRRSELLFDDRSSYSAMGIPIRRWEFLSGDGNSYSDFGVPIRIWNISSGILFSCKMRLDSLEVIFSEPYCRQNELFRISQAPERRLNL